ncbi:MAG: MFS transporter, partial [Actinobacteria bacterium]|nr:MFS transporter [Actinomycetota bacterium]
MTDSKINPDVSDKPAAGWTPMIFIGLGVALIIMDATIVNVILPTIITDLGINSIDAEWVNAVYALTFAAFLIVAGRLGDRYGRRLVFILGGLVFAGSSILAATSNSAATLIAARAVQGLGGAMISPTSLSIVNDLYKGKSRAIAFAFYGSIIGGMAALGPLLGGWLTQTFSWHWSFWINVPISLFVAIGAWRFVPKSRAEDDLGAPDWVGAVLSSVGIAALIFALIEGRNYGWWNATRDSEFLGRTWVQGQWSPVAYAFLIAIVGLVELYFYETRRTAAGKSALIDFDLFKIPTFGFGSFAGLIVSLGEFGILFSLPLFMQSVLGWSALGAGGLLASLALGAFFAAPTAAQIANRRNPRFVARLGLALEIIGIIGIVRIVPETKNPNPQRLDIPGLLISIAGLVALVYGIIHAGAIHKFADPTVIGWVLVGLGLLALFFYLEKRSDHKSFDVTLFSNRPYAISLTAVSLAFFALSGITFTLPFYLQIVRDYSTLMAGLAFVPFALGQIISAPRSAKMVARFGNRNVMTLGLLLVGLALIGMSQLQIDTPIWLA